MKSQYSFFVKDILFCHMLNNKVKAMTKNEGEIVFTYILLSITMADSVLTSGQNFSVNSGQMGQFHSLSGGKNVKMKIVVILKQNNFFYNIYSERIKYKIDSKMKLHSFYIRDT